MLPELANQTHLRTPTMFIAVVTGLLAFALIVFIVSKLVKEKSEENAKADEDAKRGGS
jgi:flagellar biosynthesis/type III secretory pathway M-ring protein FliF/YscJ